MAYGSLLADVVQSSATGTPPQFNDTTGTQTGTLCRAWVMWTTISSTVAIQSSFNVSSVTRISSGQYTITLTTAMTDNKFSAIGASNSGGTTALGQTPTWGDRQSCVMPVTSSTISYINGQTNSSTGMNDATVNSCAVFR